MGDGDGAGDDDEIDDIFPLLRPGDAAGSNQECPKDERVQQVKRVGGIAQFRQRLRKTGQGDAPGQGCAAIRKIAPPPKTSSRV